MNKTDILEIDTSIKKRFQEDEDKLLEYKTRLEDLNAIRLKKDLPTRLLGSLDSNISTLETKIADIETKETLNYYIADTAVLVEEYLAILKTPIKVSFTGKANTFSKEKAEIENRFFKVASKYMDVDISPSTKKKKQICSFCGGKTFEITDDNIYVCVDCSAEQSTITYSTSYKDASRVNLATKFTYARNIHFRDCVNQYQGKQNSTIEDDVYTKLEELFESFRLLEKGPDKYKNITKEHIMLFLKDLGYTKHYENVNLIHYTITGVKLDDISHLEDQLMDDFDTLVNLYDTMYKNISRKNFINSQYVLYHLLMRHKHPCKKEDFTILKTIDRELFHDEICKTLFETLGWNFSSAF